MLPSSFSSSNPFPLFLFFRLLPDEPIPLGINRVKALLFLFPLLFRSVQIGHRMEEEEKGGIGGYGNTEKKKERKEFYVAAT